jgi:putative transferase (TIGR04331 family)
MSISRLTRQIVISPIKSKKYEHAMKSPLFIWDAGAVETGLDVIGRSQGVLLAHLKYLVDEFHGVVRSIEYYDLVAGFWLDALSQNIYCAWRDVVAGIEPVEISPIPVIKSLAHAQTMIIDISWHQHLCSAVGLLLQGQSSGNWVVEQGPVRIDNDEWLGVAGKLLQRISTAKPKILLVQPYYKCSRREWMGALWRWRSWIAWDDLRYPISVSSNADLRWRKKQSTELSLPPRNFVELVMTLMPLYLPITLLEGFEDYRTAALALSLPRPQAVYSANALHKNLTFKVLMAEWRQEGTQLLYGQHGGGYGMEPRLAVEDYEIRVSDRFYSWGWQREGLPVYPLSPAMPFARRKSKSKHILMVCLDLPKVPYRLMFLPLTGTIETVHRNTCEFLMGLLDRRNLIIRPYPRDYGWGAFEMMRSAAPDAKFDMSSKFSTLIFACRLVVLSYLGTTWLETLGLNIPTVCFCDPAVYIFSAEAQVSVAALYNVGILHHSGKDAAHFVTSLGNDIEGWWNKAETQEARRNFVEQYANFSLDWKEQWEQEFKAVLDAARK